MRKTKQYDMRGFHILSDAIGHFTPIDGVCQFEYKNHQISVSTAGLSKGACQNEIFVFGGPNRDIEMKRTRTVQEAIQFVDSLLPTMSECQIVETPDIFDKSGAHAELHTKIAELVKTGWSIAGYTNDHKKNAIWIRAVNKQGE